MTEITTHDHEFDGPPTRGHVRMCIDRRCTAMRVGTGTSWRELTSTEQTNVTIYMMEDLIIAQTGQIIHGERWREWFAKVRGAP